MLNKKIMVIVILLVSLLAISGVSAVDNVTRDIVSNDVASEEVVSVENDKQVIESVDVEIDYLNTNSEGTFTDLANEITNAKGELNLTKNYRYHSNIDSNYQNGIVITKKITINGNGVIIDGGKQTRAIVISYGGVVLNNISFVNCNNRGGAGAIHWYGNDGMLFDCSFVNCSSSSINTYKDGGAVDWSGSNGMLFDCSFVNCSSTKSGGSVFWSGNEGMLFDCDFINSSSYDQGGGALYLDCSNFKITNCTFINNYVASNTGGALGSLSTSINVTILNCSFINNTADWGGALDLCGYNITLNHCLFDNNVAKTYSGGAIRWYQIKGGKIIDCYFHNNVAVKYGSDILYQSQNGDIINYYSDNLNGIFFESGSSNVNITRCSLSFGCENFSLYYADDKSYSAHLTTSTGFSVANKSIKFEIYRKGVSKVIDTISDENGIAKISDISSILDVGIWNIRVINENNQYVYYNSNALIQVNKSNSSVKIYDINTSWDSETTFTAHVNSNNKTINEGTVSFYIGDEFMGDASVINGTAVLTNEAPGYAGEHKITAIFNSNNYLSSNSTAKMFVDTGDIEVEDYDSIATFKALIELIENTPKSGVLNLTKNYIYVLGSNSGVQINKPITIDGQGHTLDGNQLSRILYVSSNEVHLKNINFVNGFTNGGGSCIYFYGSNGTIDSCNFTNSSSRDKIGAVEIAHDENKVMNCIFTNNTAKHMAGIGWNNDNCGLINCIFINNYASTYGGAMGCFGENGYVENCQFIHNKNSWGASVYWGQNAYYGIVINCSFIYNSGHSSYDNQYAVAWYSDYGNLINCSFKEELAINWAGNNGKLINCSFIDKSTNNIKIKQSQTIDIIKRNIGLTSSNHIFEYNNPEIMSVDFKNILDNLPIRSDVIFLFNDGANNKFFTKRPYNNSIDLFDELSTLNVGNWTVNVIFNGDDNYYPTNITNTITILPSSSSLVIGDVNTTVSHEITLVANVNSTLAINEGIVTFFDGETNIGETGVYGGVATLTYTPFDAGEHTITAIFNSNNYLSSNSTAKLLVDNATVEILVNTGTVGYNSTFVANVNGLYSIINEGNVAFYINKEYIGTVPVVDGYASLVYTPLTAGDYTVRAVFRNSAKFLDDESSTVYTVKPVDSTVTIDDLNGTVGHELTLIANIVSSNNLTINEGVVTFFDCETNIGEANVYDSIATLTYIPTNAGEHKITAIFNSNNYLSSNSTAKLLVDNATVEILVNTGTVGYNSTFVANVKGLYSIINEGTITFYINDEYLDTVPVVDGYASLAYIPLATGDYTVKAVFSGSKMFLIDENSTIFTVKNADSELFISDLNGTIGHELIILVAVLSHNNLTINEGCVVFFDGETNIGKANVYDTVATLVYTPSTVGEHKITAIFNSDNYGSSNDTALLTVSKDDVELNIDYITDVYFTNPSNFAVNVNSNFKPVTEGKVKYYVNNELVGTVDVYEGNANFNYVTGTAGSFTLTAAYEETDNYFAKNASATFNVNKMPTTLSGESIIFDEEAYKTFTTELKDNNNNGVGGQPVKIEVIKYSGESRTLTGISDANGITIYDVDNLAGGMWYVTGTYDGNDNYVESTFADKFIIVRMDTTTAIEEITNPLVNHTYKFKANIYDENEKLVKEGIIQFYLDGVDIGFIDLSNSNGYQNDLSKGVLGAINPIFAYELGADEEASDLYIEYIPTKAGKHTLTAVYEGTTIYKSSNQTTTFIVSEESNVEPEIIIPPLDEPSTDGSVTISLPSDAIGTVTLTIGGKDYVFDVVNGVANVKLPELGDGNYNYTITYSGDNKYSSFSTNGNMKINNTKPEDTKPTPEIIIPPLDEPSSDGSVTIILPNDATGKVTLSINGKSYNYLVENGVANVIIPNLGEGDYPYTITYSGDSKYSSFTTNGSLNKSAPKVDPKITAKNTAVQYSAKGKYSVTVYGTDGKVATGVEVVFKISGKQVGKAKTNTKGVASYVVTKNPGKYKIQATALGKSVTKTVTVKHIVTLKTVTLKKSAKKLTLQATLAKVNGKYLKKKTITFKINGKKVATAKTNSKGVAKITIKNPNVVKKLKVGKKVTYQATYLKDTVKKTAKIKK